MDEAIKTAAHLSIETKELHIQGRQSVTGLPKASLKKKMHLAQHDVCCVFFLTQV